VIAVRPAGPSDVPAIAGLHCRSFPESLAARLGPAWIAARYRAQLADAGWRLYVADPACAGFLAIRLPGAEMHARAPLAAAVVHLLADGDAIGWLTYAARLAWHGWRGGDAPPWPPDAAAIDYVAVDASRRGQGVGGALMAAALADPATADLGWAVTTTADNAAAVALYQRHRFMAGERWRGYDGRAYVRLHRRA
jgi:ribosomal protein S18 acetylase RimI-like enzyme